MGFAPNFKKKLINSAGGFWVYPHFMLDGWVKTH